ncbi:MAG: hypothetical protein AMXMBFR64_20140 [Myxococcales bacterium]
MEKRVIFVFVVSTLFAIVWLSVVNWQHVAAEEVAAPETTAPAGASPTPEAPPPAPVLPGEVAPVAAPQPAAAAAVPTGATTVTVPQGTPSEVVIERPPLYRAFFSSSGANLGRFLLLNPQYEQKQRDPIAGVPEDKLAAGPLDLVSTWSPAFYPFRIEWTRLEGTDEAATLLAAWRQGPEFTLVEQTDDSQTWVWPDPKAWTGDVFIEKTYRFTQGYVIEMALAVHNVGKSDVTAQLVMHVDGWQDPKAEEGGMFTPRPDLKAASCMAGDEVEREEFHSLLKEGKSIELPGQVRWASVDTRYFTVAALPRDLANSQCTLSATGIGVVSARIYATQPTIVSGSAAPCGPAWLDRPGLPRCAALYAKLGLSEGANAKQLADAFADAATKEPAREAELKAAWDSLRSRGGVQFHFGLYVGPKDIDMLKQAGETFTEALDFGILSFLAVPMLYVLRTAHDYIPSWALAIVILTVLVKLLLWPLTQKSFGQMQRMQLLRPEMDKLREKFGSDKAKLNQEMLQLYKTHKVNPLGGCLPMLLQMPVYIALYQTIYHSVELYQAPLFGWVTDLSAPDPYFVLPLVLGLTMFVQQKLTPTSMDSAQAKMMMWIMPIMFTGFMLFLPSGLVLYIFVNTILSLAQQYALKRKMEAPAH